MYKSASSTVGEVLNTMPNTKQKPVPFLCSLFTVTAEYIEFTLEHGGIDLFHR